ncbi:MAG: hypothetical protein GY869_00890 [Planctomycetes bacterium]|nr:hypothetical protein [Planctomycetota bacterium]
MGMEVVALAYLKSLKQEQAKIDVQDRLMVPNYGDIAKALGISSPGVQGFLYNDRKSINMSIVNGLVALLRKCGHDTQFSDIVAWVGELPPRRNGSDGNARQ